MNTQYTAIYLRGEFVRNEKLVTLNEYVLMGRLNPGQRLSIGDIVNGSRLNTRVIWIGDATPYIMPTTNDGGIGWFSSPLMNKFVLEVNEY